MLSDGQRDIIREAERDARDCEEGMEREGVECPKCCGNGYLCNWDWTPGERCDLCDGRGRVAEAVAEEFERFMEDMRQREFDDYQKAKEDDYPDTPWYSSDMLPF
jgi:hypothetical protein